jgi:NAD(P)H-dependent flavin oxidoreductase YrpB (nitropropane dioxygenase family)
MKRSHELSWSQVLMAANAPMLYRAGLHEGREDIGITASGQVVGLIEDIPSCEELIDRIVAEAAAVLRRLDERDR